MNMIADLTVVPIGVGISLSKYVAACEDILKRTGLKTTLHPNGTAIEGEWDAVMAAVKACHEKVHGMGAPRVFTILKIGTRTDREQSLEDKVNSVEEKLQG
ncbi:MAG: MTH1187 family thiamine-binding protein [Verrucomicrobia bacterium]|nr:MTH1187 family thiamine-binding protein [Verrucomicrobiota bacterium]